MISCRREGVRRSRAVSDRRATTSKRQDLSRRAPRVRQRSEPRATHRLEPQATRPSVSREGDGRSRRRILWGRGFEEHCCWHSRVLYRCPATHKCRRPPLRGTSASRSWLRRARTSAEMWAICASRRDTDSRIMGLVTYYNVRRPYDIYTADGRLLRADVDNQGGRSGEEPRTV